MPRAARAGIEVIKLGLGQLPPLLEVAEEGVARLCAGDLQRWCLCLVAETHLLQQAKGGLTAGLAIHKVGFETCLVALHAHEDAYPQSVGEVRRRNIESSSRGSVDRDYVEDLL